MLDRLRSGVASSVRVTGRYPRVLSGYQLWMAIGATIGWGEVLSPNFEVRREPDGYVFTGRGVGHGVGMCQWGARGRAIAHWSAQRILAAYYPGTTLGP